MHDRVADVRKALAYAALDGLATVMHFMTILLQMTTVYLTTNRTYSATPFGPDYQISHTVLASPNLLFESLSMANGFRCVTSGVINMGVVGRNIVIKLKTIGFHPSLHTSCTDAAYVINIPEMLSMSEVGGSPYGLRPGPS